MFALVRNSYAAVYRDLRSGQINALLLSTALGVAALSSVGFLSSSLERGLARDARQMLGGDAVVTSSFATPQSFVLKAEALHLSTSQTLGFPTMARAVASPGAQSRVATDARLVDPRGAQMPPVSKLVSLKAVDSNYPLRGRLTGVVLGDPGNSAREALAKPARPVIFNDTPSPGQAWVEATVMHALGISAGGEIQLGQAKFTVTRVLSFEPDKGLGLMNLGPRVLISKGDLEATKLVQPSSRINWRFAVAGDEASVQAFTNWASDALNSQANQGVRLETLESGRPQIKQTMDRAVKFLKLVALLSVVLSAVAVGLAAQTYAKNHLQECAIRRVLGQSQQDIVAMFALGFTLYALVASAAGLIIGFGVHFVFVGVLSAMINKDLPLPGVAPVIQGLGVGLCCLLAFGLPPVLQLAKVSAVQVLRREYGQIKPMSVLVLLGAVLGLGLLMSVVSRDYVLTLEVVAGFLCAIAFFVLCAWLFLLAVRGWLQERSVPVWLRIAARQSYANKVHTLTQISSLGVGLLVILLLILLKTDLLQSWRNATPADSPNRFVIDIQDDQAQAFTDFLKSNNILKFDFNPMIKGRLIEINNTPVTANRYADERAQHLVEREFNISYTNELPPDNEVVAGVWRANEASGLSIEEGLAKTLKLRLGDSLRFDISGTVYDKQITSVRKVNWGTMRTNFFVLLPLKAVGDVPQSYIAAFKAPDKIGPDTGALDTSAFDNQLSNTFPNATQIDTGALLNQIQSITEQVISAVELLFGFTLIAALMVLSTSVHHTHRVRLLEFALIRSLGGGDTLIRRVQRAELLAVGTLAGLTASVCAALLGWGAAKYVFEFDWIVSPLFIPGGVLLGAFSAWLSGSLALRGAMKESVVQTLRNN